MIQGTGYAQNSVQLLNQLRSLGYPVGDRDRVFAAYEFGMRLFSGLYLPSGKPFVDHLVGTASILASVKVDADVVVAGLVHAAYAHGDFGQIRRRGSCTASKRRAVTAAVGPAVEAYVARYTDFVLTRERLLALETTVDGLDDAGRKVLLMRLANDLEHRLDFGDLYSARDEQEQASRLRKLDELGPIMVETAATLGYASLASAMRTVFRHEAAARLPVGPCIRTDHHTAYLVRPASYRERLWAPPARQLLRMYRRLRRGPEARI